MNRLLCVCVISRIVSGARACYLSLIAIRDCVSSLSLLSPLLHSLRHIQLRAMLNVGTHRKRIGGDHSSLSVSV
jgi:hypothetical protein